MSYLNNITRTPRQGNFDNLIDKQQSLSKAKWSTRLAFFIAGFGLSSWAPLVPFAQQRIQADSATLGIILLCLGLGAVIGMPIAGGLSGKVGSRLVIFAGTIGVIIALPLLAIVSSSILLGTVLILFGASIGAIDVAANIHGTEVQQKANTPLMSSFHGFYSIGGLIGVSFVTLLIAVKLHVSLSAIAAAIIICLCILVARKGFLITKSVEKYPLFVIPKGIVFMIGILAMLIFLAEGAMLDWGAILLIQVKNVATELSGAGYVIFALTMTASRFIGDKSVSLFGVKAMLFIGVFFTAVGLFFISFFDQLPLVLISVAIAGFAAGNVVPILFTLAGYQKIMPISHAIAATSILGYCGVLVGPAIIGFVAHLVGISNAFKLLACLILISISIIPTISSIHILKRG